jgi:hypothetical protein
MVSKLLHSGKNNSNEALKWFLILLSVGTGFFIVSLFQPLGIHSIGILAVALAVGFFTYYIFIRKTDN